MNMISTGAFLNEMDASNKQPTVAEKFAAVWEKKNAKAARAGGVSLMALSLAACGSSSTTSSTTSTTTTTTASSNSNFTSNIDTLTGGAGDDTFTGDANTVSEADSVTGGAGSDTVKIYGDTGLPQLSGVETFYQKSLARDLDISAATDVTSVELDAFSLAAARDVKLTTDASLTISNTTGTANAITLSNNVSTAQTITMTKSGDSTNAVDIDIDGDAVATLNVSSTATGTTGTSYMGLANTGAALTTVNVTGSGDLVIEDVVVATAINITSTGKTTVDTAVAKVVVTGGAGADTITLDHASGTAREFTVNAGAGDDKIDVGAMVLAADLTDSKVTISGGDGTDILAMKSAMGAALSGLTAANFAKKGIANDFETIQITNQAATTDALGLARVGSNVTKVDYAAGLGDAQTLTGLASGGTVVLGAADSNSGADKLTVTVLDADAAGAISDTLNITLDAAHAGGTIGYGIIEAANVEIVNINSTSTKATALTTSDKNDVDVIFANAHTINISGNVYADIDGDKLDGVVQVIDASANTAGVSVEVDDTIAVKITGTAAADVIVGGAGADVIDGGAGIDTITGGVGADTITTGAGADNVVISSGLTMDTVKDFTVGTGGDQIDLDISVLETANTGIASTTMNFVNFKAGAAGTDVTTSSTNKIVTISTDATTASDIEGADIIVLGGNTYADNAAALDAMEANGDRTITHTNNFSKDDSFFFIYSNSTTGDVTLAAANVSAADDHSAGTATFSAGLLEGIDLVGLDGVTDLSSLVLANIDIV